MPRKYRLAAMISLVLLGGCGEDTETVRNVEWYKSHPEERKAMLKECSNNPGVKNPNCMNAFYAD